LPYPALPGEALEADKEVSARVSPHALRRRSKKKRTRTQLSPNLPKCVSIRKLKPLKALAKLACESAWALSPAPRMRDQYRTTHIKDQWEQSADAVAKWLVVRFYVYLS
jgi:hypothetical protein